MKIGIFDMHTGERLHEHEWDTFPDAVHEIETNPFLSTHRHCPDILTEETTDV